MISFSYMYIKSKRLRPQKKTRLIDHCMWLYKKLQRKNKNKNTRVCEKVYLCIQEYIAKINRRRLKKRKPVQRTFVSSDCKRDDSLGIFSDFNVVMPSQSAVQCLVGQYSVLIRLFIRGKYTPIHTTATGLH